MLSFFLLGHIQLLSFFIGLHPTGCFFSFSLGCIQLFFFFVGLHPTVFVCYFWLDPKVTKRSRLNRPGYSGRRLRCRLRNSLRSNSAGSGRYAFTLRFTPVRLGLSQKAKLSLMIADTACFSLFFVGLHPTGCFFSFVGLHSTVVFFRWITSNCFVCYFWLDPKVTKRSRLNRPGYSGRRLRCRLRNSLRSNNAGSGRYAFTLRFTPVRLGLSQKAELSLMIADTACFSFLFPFSTFPFASPFLFLYISLLFPCISLFISLYLPFASPPRRGRALLCPPA